MRFATRVLLLQLAAVVAVVLACTAVFAVLAVQQLRAAAESTALGIARTVAEDPDVRRLVARWSSDPGTPDAAALAAGELQEVASGVTSRTDALFVVITDDHGIRLAHPDPARLGEEVSTDFADVIAGNEVVEWQAGTLGESARAKVPVLAPTGDGVIGEVSVGFERANVFDDLPALLAGLGVAAGIALAIGTLAGLLLRRRWERLTLGLQPEELVALVQQQAAVLDGVGDGVVALDDRGIVRVCTAAAAEMLGLDDESAVGRTFAELGLPAHVVSAVAEGIPQDGVVIGGRVLYLDVQPVRRGRRSLGDVVIVRDRTDIVALSERLDSVRAMTSALRVQRHEFANRMHVAAGLLDAERVADARAFLADLVDRGPVEFTVPGLERVSDPFLHSLLGAKGIEAGERGVELRISPDSLLLGELLHVEDAAAIIGNLTDNAVGAAVTAPEPRWVEVTLLSDGDALVLTVADSGGGLARDVDPFTRAPRPDDDRAMPDRVHGLGIGLPLSRELARRRGGDLWVIDPGGERDGGGGRGGAVIGARLPGILTPHPREEPAS